jgi:hypothetical protein
MGADLAALIASPHFVWMPGMAGIDVNGDRWRYCHDGGRRFPYWINEYSRRAHWREVRLDMRPDLDDPATIGCLAHLARKAWNDSRLFCMRLTRGAGAKWAVVGTRTADGCVSCSGETEGKVWAAAILAAPPPEVNDV